MENLESLFSNLENHIRELRDKKILNRARKSIECICKIILLQSGVLEEEYKTKLAQALIDYLNEDRVAIEKNTLKLLKSRLNSINTIASIDSHDNSCILTDQEFQRVNNDLDYIMNRILDTSIINFDIEIPVYLVELYKFIAIIEEEDWKCQSIISLVYPNRKINDKIIKKKFNFSTISEEFSEIGYLFLGRNLSFTQTFQEIKEFNEKNNIQLNGLTILFPNEISKLTNKPVHKRKETIAEKAQEIFKPIPIKCEFIDKYILEKCLPFDIAIFSDIPTEPYYIDQLLHHNSSTLKSSEFIEKIITKYVGFDESSKPIYLILGSGGAGKTTFCEESINIINQSKDKKAILISSSLISLNYNNSKNVESLQDLLRITHPQLLSDIGEERLEINIRAGNLIIIIDGIDEIISNLKERFSIERFIESINDLNDTYLNCTLIMTTRIQDKFIEQIKENKNLELYELKGFDKEAAEVYFNKRFKDLPNKPELIKRSNEHLKSVLDNNSQTSPLILRLISELVTDNSGYDVTSDSSSIFLKIPLDSIIYQIIEREILKQSLEISCNDYLEILNEVVSSGGSMSVNSFSEVTSIYSPNSNVNSFCISPLLKKEQEFIRIKYDSLITWFQSRFVCHFLTSEIYQTIDINIIEAKLKSLSENFIKTELLQAINFLDKSRKEETIKHNIKIILSKIYQMYDKPSFRKISYNLLILISYYVNPKEKEDLTTLIADLYPIKNDREIHGLCILDQFRPIDFSRFSIHHSYFDGYLNLLKSKIPKEKTIFYNSKFINFDTPDFPKGILVNENFDKNCSLDEGLKNILSISEDNIQKKSNDRKDDLFKILKCSYSSGKYGWKSEGIYKQQCNTLKSDLSLKEWLNLLIEYNILEKTKSRSSGDNDVGYEVVGDKKSVSDFITQKILSNNLKSLLANIHNKS